MSNISIMELNLVMLNLQTTRKLQLKKYMIFFCESNIRYVFIILPIGLQLTPRPNNIFKN